MADQVSKGRPMVDQSVKVDLWQTSCSKGRPMEDQSSQLTRDKHHL